MEINRGAKKFGELHPAVGPEVTAKMNKMTAMVSTDTPTMSRRFNFSEALRATGSVSIFSFTPISEELARRFWRCRSSAIEDGMRRKQAKATGVATIAVK